MFGELLVAKRRVLGPEHPGALASMSSLGTLYLALKRFADSESIQRRVLETSRRRSRTQTPPNIYARQGRYDEAKQLHLETLAIGQRAVGARHSQVGLSLYGLGRLALKQGDRRKALDYLRQARDHGLAPGELKQLHEDEELKPLRGDPDFEALIAEAKAPAQ